MPRKRLTTLIVTVVAVGAFATAGGAVANTVSVSPGGAFDGTASTASQLTFNTARRTINCTVSTFNAGLWGGTSFSVGLPYRISSSFYFAFSTCTLTGGLRPTLNCTAFSASLDVTSTTVGGVTQLAISPFNCQVSLSASCHVPISGSVSGSFANATRVLSVASPSGQSLAAFGTTCATLPNDSYVTLGASGGGALNYATSPSQTILVS